MQTLKQQYKEALRQLKYVISTQNEYYYICHLPIMVYNNELLNHFQNEIDNLETLHSEIYKETRKKFINLYGPHKYSTFVPFLSTETELRIKLLNEIIKSL